VFGVGLFFFVGSDFAKAIDVTSRARIDGLLPWNAIDDETRPVELNGGFSGIERFVELSVERFLRGYSRNLTQSQPDHIEILAEKLTLRTILSNVAWKHKSCP
jgi:hypothetical protein